MELPEAFAHPPATYGPVPFWWWTGERLTRERLAWQLDQLRAKGVGNAIVSYSHTPTGETDPGDPPLFSAEWWDLFRWVVDYSKRHGMQIGFQDYTIVNRTLQRIGESSPDMRGFGSLRQIARHAREGEAVCLQLEPGADLVAALAYRVVKGKIEFDSATDLASLVAAEVLNWHVPEGEWQISLIFVQPNAFDPTHPESGTSAIESLYAIFEGECPGELGKTISILFQDELDFFNHRGAGFPIWSQRVEAEFARRKGYEVRPWLPALWHDLGPRTAKVRIDYNDVCVALLEENYFKPIHDWCERRGVLLGNDNCGRGGIAAGHHFYGDYFRTMRWFGAPGNDDAGPARGHAFAGFKVNSSIAHLYRRPRVWNEAFHSSGWGFTPAEMIAGFNEDSAYGATLFNLHGLYYTTHGSWWEWAPPDFHFRQPYWRHIDVLNDYARRVSFLLSQGVHRCDVAIVYPITAIEAGLGAAETEKQAFGLGRFLFEAGIDFDFVDFESFERATVRDGELEVSGERYRVMLFPMMTATRWSTLEKARDFVRARGVVIAFGCVPRASDRAGGDDPELDALVEEIWKGGSGVFVPAEYADVKRAIDERIVRDFIPSVSDVFGLHREIGHRAIYFVFNRRDEMREVECFFRASGGVESWDAWNGSIQPLAGAAGDQHGTRVSLVLQPREARLIVFDRNRPFIASLPPSQRVEPVLELDGPWEFELVPTMDNRFGDFRLPASDGFLGAEARRFRYAEENEPAAPWFQRDFDDASWPEVTCSFGPRFWRLGPIAPGTDTTKIEGELRRQVDPARPLAIDGEIYHWEPYDFSLRWGIENDPFLKDVLSGPHGLKKRVPDDFIDLGAAPAGGVCYLWTSVESDRARTVPMVMGSRSQYESWLNGEPALAQDTALPPGEYAMWKLPHYDSQSQQRQVALRKGSNPLLLKFVIPGGQRLRAYVAFDPPARAKDTLGLRWFSQPGNPHFNYRPDQPSHAGWYRFHSPPGLAGLAITSRGPVRIWVDGAELEVSRATAEAFHAVVPAPSRGMSIVAIRAEQPPDSFAGDTLLEPVRMNCVTATAPLGNWCDLGLATYSGSAWYRKKFSLTRKQAENDSLVLELGRVSATAEVRWNGRVIGKKIAPPWTVELKGLAKEGENSLEILVTNTLANHYRVAIPTPYALPAQSMAGLFGPVRIIRVIGG